MSASTHLRSCSVTSTSDLPRRPLLRDTALDPMAGSRVNRRVTRTTERTAWTRVDRSSSLQVVEVTIYLALLFVAPACFHPSYDRPACAPDGECPSGLICSSARTCEPADSIGPVPDASVDALSTLCNGLTCDPNAICGSACACKAGFVGDGLTCADIDECAAHNGGCAAACMNTPGGFACYAPTSCADIKSHRSSAADGDYTLYLGGDVTRPWKAYCAGMANAPAEYLSLTGTNFGQYTAGGRSPGTDVRTTYTKIRFDPVTLKVDISDRTFATSTGSLKDQNTTPVTSMPYASGMDCAGANSMTGVAQMDLSGTAFEISNTNIFINGGVNSSGLVQIGDKQHESLIGGGNCGWTGPKNIPGPPFNNNVTSATGSLLLLDYVSPPPNAQ